MGNYNTRAVRFRQSLNDFPLIVELGRRKPDWGLFRWSGNTGLRFVPLDDEGFTLRGDKQQLIYKGRWRSHRFTILGENAFEYDCILLREPDTNVITLLLEGAENFDFFRQPDFVPDPFLKGSYAVYKKETLLGEGTGKLCHIHRPEIIDARGRRCWGDISIVGNVMQITIPENWLNAATYPAIVDPVVGTNTIGSQTIWYDPDNEENVQLFFEFMIVANRFQLPDTFNGNGTAYVYAYERDYWGRCQPVLYSDNNNVPLTRRSANEGTFDIAVSATKPASWRSTSIRTNTSLASGSFIWFGFYSEWFAPRFDWGAKCYREWWEQNGLPSTFPVWNANYFLNFKLSMYFEYTNAQNFVRTLTQGVSLADTRNLKAEYKRNSFEIVQPVATAKGMKIFLLKLQEAVHGLDKKLYSVFFVRNANDIVNLPEIQTYSKGFFLRLFDIATSKCEGKLTGVLILKLFDTVQAVDNVLRGLLLTVRLFTGLFVRDYLLKRFLKARSELELKSCITREIILENKIY